MKVVVKAVHDQRTREFPEGVLAYAAITATAVGADLPYELELDLELHGDSYQCVELRCTKRPKGDPVSSEGLRAVPVGRVKRAAVERAVEELLPAPDGWELVLEQPELPTGRTGPSDDVLRWVARVYRIALLGGDAPTEQVVETLGIPRATAGRWVAAAREKGFLRASAPRHP